jgi:alkanesulfonate monooxygenase
MDLRFHWMLPKGGEVSLDRRQTPAEANRYRIAAPRGGDSPAPRPDLRGWTHFAKHAEAAGIDSVLISFSAAEPEPVTVSCALGQAVDKLKFILAYRSGLTQPTTFVQQINTLSALIGGRLSINIVAGSSSAEQQGYGDFLAHDERYARADEFLAVCDAFWRNGGDVNYDGRYYRVAHGRVLTPYAANGHKKPDIYVSGHSDASERLAVARGSCWLRVADHPETLAPSVARMRAQGLNVCLRMCVLCRPTREEALADLAALAAADEQLRTGDLLKIKDDSQMYRDGAAIAADQYWLDRSLWAGFVPHRGPVWTTLVGSPDDLADAFIEYKKIGVNEFILSGWPELDEVDIFGRDVLPLVRKKEREL